MLLKRIALGATGSAVAGMVALTVYSAGLSAPAAADDADPSAPDESSVTFDRDPHSRFEPRPPYVRGVGPTQRGTRWRRRPSVDSRRKIRTRLPSC